MRRMLTAKLQNRSGVHNFYIPNGMIITSFYCAKEPENKLVANTLMTDTTSTEDEAVVEVFKKLRPGDQVTVDSARSLIRQMFFNPQRYDLEPVGRYKMNKRLKLDVPEEQIDRDRKSVV